VTFAAHFRRYTAALREEQAPVLPVKVAVISRPSRIHGQAKLVENARGAPIGFLVNVYRRVPKWGTSKFRAATEQELVDALIHEWAHCLAWNNSHLTLSDHDELFGVAYARCYNSIVAD
jgi:hypothetical protein